MESLVSIADAEALIRMVASASDPTTEQSTGARKRQLLDEMRNLVGAAVWIWSTGVRNLDQPGDAMAVNILDDGWNSPQERTAFIEMNTNQEHTCLLFAELHNTLLAGRIYT